MDQPTTAAITTLILEHVESDTALTVAVSGGGAVDADLVKATAHASVGPIATATDRVRAAVGDFMAIAINQKIAETFGPNRGR